MKYVLDASVALKWVLPEFDSPQAHQVRAAFQSGVHDLISPDIFPVEIAHALTRAERQQRISVGDSLVLLADILSSCPVLHDGLPLLDRAAELSSHLRIGVYDCLYVALAEQEACELVTADDRLIRSIGAPCVALSSV
jgi:predicted nucleic acid-binding protein